MLKLPWFLPDDSPEVRKLLDGYGKLDVEKRKEAFARVQKLAMESALWAPISFSLELDAMSTKVKGYKPNLLGKPKFENIWLDT